MADDNPYLSIDETVPHEKLLQQAIKTAGAGPMGIGSVFSQMAAPNASELGPNVAALGPGGLPATSFGVKDIEKGLPSGMQTLGNIAGGEVGLTEFGAPVRGGAIGGTIGRAVGDLGKQGIESLFRGQSPSIGEFGKQSLLGAGTETLGMPFAFATNQLLSGPAGEEFRNTTGKILGGLKDRIANSGMLTHVGDITGYLRNAVDHIRGNFEIDPGIANHLESMADDLENVADNKNGMLEPQDIMNATKNLDLKLKSIGIYGNKVPKDYNAAGEMADARGMLAGQTENTANDIGIGNDFRKAKDVYSKVATAFPRGSNKHGILKAMLEAGGIHNLIRGQLPEAIGNTLASEAVGSSPLRTGIYNLLKVGKGLPTGIAELLNQSENKNENPYANA